jgi:hypothetical protein
VNLARAEDEVGREITLRLPIAKRNVATLIEEAKEGPSNGTGKPIAQTALVSPTALAQPAVQQDAAAP